MNNPGFFLLGGLLAHFAGLAPVAFGTIVESIIDPGELIAAIACFNAANQKIYC